MNFTPTSAQAQKKIESRLNRLAALPDPHNWCVEINTDFPIGRYDFGPFDSRQAAEASRSDYVDTLCREEARGIVALVRHCQIDAIATPLLGADVVRPHPTTDERGSPPKKWF
jgi:hypothetical protein